MRRLIQRICAVLIGLLFVFAGVLKVRDPAGFAVDVLNYRILPWHGAVIAALYLPWVEILCGAALVLGKLYRGGLCIAAALLAMFIGAYASTRPRGLDVECGCFGHGVHRGYWPTLAGDAFLLLVLLWIIRTEFRPLSPVIRSARVP
jgi:putative oxidoreductase